MQPYLSRFGKGPVFTSEAISRQPADFIATGQQQNTVLFDYLVGTVQQGWWNADAQRLSGFQIDRKHKFGGLLDW